MKVKYPNPSIKIEKPNKSKSHGMLFENGLNISNEYYRIHNRAIIYKKPTPIQVVKVEYPARNKARIAEAFYRVPSTTDYNGIYRGQYLDYEAKETNNLSFAFKHIYPHQIEHLTKVAEMGDCFHYYFYRKVNEIYLIDIKVFNELVQLGEKGGLKSIPVEVAKAKGQLVTQGYTPPIDYLAAVDLIYF